MSHSPSPSPASPALAIVAHALAFVLGGGVLLAFADGPEGFLEWMRYGGLPMWLLLLAFPAQTGVGIFLALLEVQRPRPLVLHVLLPSLIALVGLGGTFLGMTKVWSAIANVSAADQATLFFAGLAEAEASRQLGFLLAGLGLLPLGAVALTSFLDGRRRQQLARETGRPFAAALLFALSGAASLWLLGRAFVSGAVSSGIAAAAMISSDQKAVLMASSYAMASLLHTAFHLLVGAAGLAGALTLALAAKHASSWARRSAAGGALAFALLGLVVVCDLALKVQQREQHGLVAAAAPRAPEGMQLPLAEDGEPSAPADLVVNGADLFFRGERLGPLGAADSAAALKERLGPHVRYGVPELSVAMGRERRATDALIVARASKEAGAGRVGLLVETPPPDRAELEALAARVGGFLPVEGQKAVGLTFVPDARAGALAATLSSTHVALPQRRELPIVDGRLPAASREALRELVGPVDRWGSDEPALVLTVAEDASLQPLVDVAAALPRRALLGLAEVPRAPPDEGLDEAAGGMKGIPPEGRLAHGSDTVVYGSLSKEVIQGGVRSKMLQIRRCYEQQLAQDPALGGKLTVKMLINGEGEVAKVDRVSSSLQEPSLEACVEGALKTLRFPKPKGGGIVLVTYPFVFSPTR